jgi:putative oxidoreductase
MEILLNLTKTNSDWVVTAVRIVLGVVLFAHGAQKLLGWYGGPGFGNTVKMLTTYVKLPTVLAVTVIFVEFLGGLGLILGFLGRLAGIGMLVIMVGAIVTVHYRYGLFMNWTGEKKGHGVEYHLLAIALALVVIIKGAGAFSLDRAFYEHQVDIRTAATHIRG